MYDFAFIMNFCLNGNVEDVYSSALSGRSLNSFTRLVRSSPDVYSTALLRRLLEADVDFP